MNEKCGYYAIHQRLVNSMTNILRQADHSLIFCLRFLIPKASQSQLIETINGKQAAESYQIILMINIRIQRDTILFSCLNIKVENNMLQQQSIF